ncbi:MAG: DUF3888 domain-containing protein [Peptococcaceae bacterium]|nr:DUF3888 domain-containing protein [Peptococcaceae bacterium]
MKTKKIIITIAVALFILVLSLTAGKLIHPSLSTIRNSEHNKQELIQRSLLKILYPYIQQEITNYYGHSKQFMDDQIVDISMYGPYDIKIKIQVTTFEGPHNPPYGTEEITVVLSDKVEVLEFKHKK